MESDLKAVGVLVVAEQPEVDEDAQKLSDPDWLRIEEVEDPEVDVAAADALEEVPGRAHQGVDRRHVLIPANQKHE